MCRGAQRHVQGCMEVYGGVQRCAKKYTEVCIEMHGGVHGDA